MYCILVYIRVRTGWAQTLKRWHTENDEDNVKSKSVHEPLLARVRHEPIQMEISARALIRTCLAMTKIQPEPDKLS